MRKHHWLANPKADPSQSEGRGDRNESEGRGDRNEPAVNESKGSDPGNSAVGQSVRTDLDDSSISDLFLIDTSTNSYARNAEIRTLLEGVLGPLKLVCETADMPHEVEQARDLGLHVADMTPSNAAEPTEPPPK